MKGTIMEAWWNRFMSRLRGDHQGLGSSGGTAALTVTHAAIAERGNAAPAGRNTTFRTSKVEPVAAAARESRAADELGAEVRRLGDRIDRLCSLLERQVASQQSRSDELLTVLNRMASESATSPAATAEQARQMQRLCDAVCAQRDETQQLAAILSELPGSLRRQQESLESQGAMLETQSEHLSALRSLAQDSNERHSDAMRQLSAVEESHRQSAAAAAGVGQRVERLAAAGETHSAALATLISERRQGERATVDRIDRHGRRLLLLCGVALGATVASATFGAIQLYLQLAH